ncbi:VOC family protein [Jannaschia pohangensis]|uniref:VOC domain-containing protein n=1 Tax=Jannaschia pohangensis TaxID=390807 RepID=A0A1I3HL46_9RHOB|nr:VOC family protein [Jannaschia pohangensis]SFI36456.1 hypothetical protein SAMN04488095_0642 [Jannaschia pohangensis]
MTKNVNAVVWAEIPVSNLAKGRAFYEAILQVEMLTEQMGPMETAVFPYDSDVAVSGHIYEGPTAGDGRGPAVSLMVKDDLPAAMARVTKAGGQVISEAIKIPAGEFFYVIDPDGNRISLFAQA